MTEIYHPPPEGQILGVEPLQDLRFLNADGRRRLKWSAGTVRKIRPGDYWTYGRAVAFVLAGQARFTGYSREKEAAAQGQGRVA